MLFNVQPIFDVGGTINKEGNQEGVDPMFADPDNGDFTVMNTALHNAADDGEIVGATYWHPDFIDDFADITTSTNEQFIAEIKLEMMPNPFKEEVTIRFELEESSRVQLEIYNLYGQKIGRVMNSSLSAGQQQQTINTQFLKPGMYVFIIHTEGKTAAKKLIKVN